MSSQKVPVRHYQKLSQQFPSIIAALENLGSSIRQEGPIQGKTAELIQLAGAAAVQSEGSVHSHTRRALEAGATQEEINHALILLISTIGFPRASAAINWAQDILDNKQ
jgi:4-carboxymuconolactone decarboxylase